MHFSVSYKISVGNKVLDWDVYKRSIGEFSQLSATENNFLVLSNYIYNKERLLFRQIHIFWCDNLII
jgi:hypothetical protein